MKELINKPVIIQDDTGNMTKGIFLNIVRCDSIDRGLVKIQCSCPDDGRLITVDLDEVRVLSDAQADVIDAATNACDFEDGEYDFNKVVDAIEEGIKVISEEIAKIDVAKAIDGLEDERLRQIKKSAQDKFDNFTGSLINSTFRYARKYIKDKDGGS